MMRLGLCRSYVGSIFLMGLFLFLPSQAQNLASAQTPDEEKMAAESSNRFAIELHKSLSQEEGNLFYSPASISMALGMTYAGAEGETQNQIGRVLHVPTDTASWLKSTEELLPLFNQNKDGFQVSLANRLWGQSDFAFNPSYLEKVEKTWQAPLGSLDFVNQLEPSRKQINQWVEARTNDRIKDLLPQGSIDANTRLVLTNAIFFKADWATQFNMDNTQEEPFAVNDSKTVKVPLMSQKAYFNYFTNDQIQFLSLPYKAGDVVMEIVLPKHSAKLAAIESSLTLDQIVDWSSRARRHDVQVFLPRFKMNSSFSMKKTLVAMGMQRAFSTNAEFGGMTSAAELQIDEVFHKAFVEVDEKGTEAAAATGVVMTLRSARPPEPILFRADHPFLMILRHQPTGLILFMGRVSDPS